MEPAPKDLHPCTVAYAEVDHWHVSTVLLADGSAFETKVFGPAGFTPDGQPCGSIDYEIRVGYREQAIANHVNAVMLLGAGRFPAVPPNGPDTGVRWHRRVKWGG